MKRKNNYFINFILLKFIFFLAFLAFFLIIEKPLVINDVKAQASPDAIAIRVIPNPNHYSALRWYKKQNFLGSPQTLTVDGYEAVRDGRTVYVNVANVVAGSLYTNIYLISYNQAAEKDTMDIFGRILDHWKFNTNIMLTGICRDDSNLHCFIDEDCSINVVCDSPKARIIRDTNRLADLAELSLELSKYKDNNGSYPSLSAGTYLPYRSISVWPSWRKTLSIDLNTSLPLDPVNEIGSCPSNFNSDTCWDEVAKSFVNILPMIPNNSLMYTFIGDPLGASYETCAIFESGLTITGANYIGAICPSICLDFDKDGYGNPGSVLCTAGSPLTDCDDWDKTKTFGTPENFALACHNGLDDNCDGFIDCDDANCTAFCTVSVPTCGNMNCDVGECLSCPTDCIWSDCCGVAPGCQPLAGESSLNCPGDCLATCGNTNCDVGECDTCPGDCSVAECCPDTTCQPAVGENSGNCTDCTCTDSDGDQYIVEAVPPAGTCGNICGPANNQPCLGNNDCDDTNFVIFPTNPEICDGLDNNCSDFDHTVIDPLQIDEGYTNENCNWVCNSNGFNWLGLLPAPLMCCGNDALEAGPYEASESSAANCIDGRDNDCDGTFDDSTNLINPDVGCLPCNPLLKVSEDAWFWALPPQADCNQCDLDGDNDGDQSPSAMGLDWVTNYPGMADRCDPDCIPFIAGPTINPASLPVNIDKFEAGVETRCDGIDNNCDGTIDEGCDDDGDGYCDNTMFLYDNNLACLNTSYSGPADDGKSGDDCDDGTGGFLIHPTASETCGDSIDSNCDGNDPVCTPVCIDNDGDQYIVGAVPLAATCGNICGPANNLPCLGNDDCDDGVGGFWINPGRIETCDGLNNDCDAMTDEGCDDDLDGYCNVMMQIYNTNAMCTNTSYTGSADDGKWGDDCDDGAGSSYPTNPEICDGLDNNCSDTNHVDGSGVNAMDIDEGLPDDSCQYTCETINSFVWTANGGELQCCGDDGLEAGPYEITETVNCSDGQDNDCNGLTDTLPPTAGPDPGCTACCDFDFNFSCEFCASGAPPPPPPPPPTS